MNAEDEKPEKRAPANGEFTLYNTKETARYLQVSVKTLAQMRCSGEGPEYIKGPCILYDLNDLNKWLDARRRTFTNQEIPKK